MINQSYYDEVLGPWSERKARSEANAKLRNEYLERMQKDNPEQFSREQLKMEQAKAKAALWLKQHGYV